MYVESLGPSDFGKVPFVNFRPANIENSGDIHDIHCRTQYFLLAPIYVLVLRFTSTFARYQDVPEDFGLR